MGKKNTAFAAAAVFAAAASAAAQPGPEADELMRRIYYEGMPPEVVAMVSAEDYPILIGMLENKGDAKYWPNVTAALGAVGGEAAIEPLMDFAKGRGGADDWSPEVYRGRASALGAVGRLAAEHGSRKAADFLVESADPEVWLDAPWVKASPDPELEALRLSIRAVRAIGTGRDKAAGCALMRLQRRGMHGMIQREALTAFGRWMQENGDDLRAFVLASLPNGESVLKTWCGTGGTEGLERAGGANSVAEVPAPRQ